MYYNVFLLHLTFSEFTFIIHSQYVCNTLIIQCLTPCIHTCIPDVFGVYLECILNVFRCLGLLSGLGDKSIIIQCIMDVLRMYYKCIIFDNNGFKYWEVSESRSRNTLYYACICVCLCIINVFSLNT